MDSAQAKTEIPEAYIMNFFFIYVSSPQKRQVWRKDVQQAGVQFQQFYMNPWALTEIKKAFEIYPDQNPQEVLALYEDMGPIPRYCFNTKKSEIESIRREQQRIIVGRNVRTGILS